MWEMDLAVIKELRDTFNSEYGEDLSLYDNRDLTRFQEDDLYADRYIRHCRGNMKLAVDLTHNTLKWRAEIKINDLNESSFPMWFHELGTMYYHNTDINSFPILISHVRKHKKDSDNLELQKLYIAWLFEKQFSKPDMVPIVMCFDMAQAKISNMDMDLIKFQINCFTNYFPALLSYMLIHNMPWVLNAIWKVINSFLSPEQQKAIVFAKGDVIFTRIPPDQLLCSMGGQDPYEYKYQAENMQDCQDSAITTSSLKQEDDSVIKDESPVKNSRPINMNLRDNKTVSSRRSLCSNKNEFRGTLISVCPADDLQFHITDREADVPCSMRLTNIVQDNISFKIKTTSPSRFRVKPSQGILKPNHSIEVIISLLAGETLKDTSDRFLMLAIVIPEEISSNSQAIKDLWKSANTNDGSFPAANYMEHRLGCTITQVASPKTQESKAIASQVTRMEEQNNKLSSQVRLLILMNVMVIFLLLLVLFTKGGSDNFEQVLPSIEKILQRNRSEL